MNQTCDRDSEDTSSDRRSRVKCDEDDLHPHTYRCSGSFNICVQQNISN